MEFGPHPGAARQARLVVRPMLLGPDDPIGEDVLLVVSELVSNVVRHANSPGVLRVADPHPDVPLRVEVEDHSLAMPTLRFPGRGQVGGLGLEILSQLADAWGIEPLVEGKVVWAVFDRRKRSRSWRQPPAG